MLKERIFNFLIVLFFGLLIIYVLHKPPTIVIKHPSIEKLSPISKF